MRKHPAEYRTLIAAEKKATDDKKESAAKPSGSESGKQLSLAAFIEKSRPWSFDCPQSQLPHKMLAEMIALDDQPFNFVNNVRFRRFRQAVEPRYSLPSDRHLRDVLLPNIYAAVKAKVVYILQTAGFVSITTDIWTTPMSSQSMISFTAHWLDKNWERKSAILHCARITSSHTASNIKAVIQSMVRSWQLTDRVHVVLRDNASDNVL